VSWHYLQGQEAVSSAAICWDGAAFAPSKSRTMLGAYCFPDSATECCPDSLSGTMLPPLTDGLGAEESMLSAADSHAKTSAQPEKAQESPGPAQGYGLTWPASSAKFDRATASWKIHPCLFPEDSMSCSVTLPRWGTMRGGVLSERTTSTPLTSGTGSGFGVSWPTPDTRGFTNDGALGLLAEACDSFEEMSGMAYRKQLKRKAEYWPTPTVACATGGQTSRSGDRNGELLLAGAVKQWPTPTVSDMKPRGTAAATARRREIGKQIGLESEVKETDPTGGSLNPTWVEWLMGWPLGWTDLKPLAMDKFQAWQRSHGGL